jgi:predicted ATPase
MIDHDLVSTRAAAGSFVGRERELGELRQFACGPRAVTVCGAAGIGKTRLLMRLLSVVAGHYPDGTFLVGLGDLRQPDLVASRVAAAVGICEEPGVPLPDTLAEALSSRRLVLALDECEHLAGACASLGQRLLASSPGLAVVAASRTPLGLADEAVWAVPPLALPPLGVTDPEQALRSDAVRLFADRAAAAFPGFALGRGNCAAVAGICRALDGLPLAIELAAAWVRVLDPGPIAARLSGRVGPLAGSGRPAGSRPRTLGAAIDWSHELLSSAEQVLLRRLSVFAGWSLEMAERVCADDGLPATQVAGLLAGLAEKALIAAEPDALGQRRYRMPGTIRDYAAARLAEAGETAALLRRLRDYTTHVSEYSMSIGMSRVPAAWAVRRSVFERYDADNVRAALGWCLEQGDVEGGLRICAAIRTCWIAAGALAEGAGWLDALLAADLSPVPASVHGPALVGRAQLALHSGDHQGAEGWAAAGLALCRAAGAGHYAALALSLLAESALRAGRPPEAVRRAEEALDEARRAGDTWNEGYALGVRATALAAAGRLAEAQASAEAGLASMVEINQQVGVAFTRLGLGDLARLRRDPDAAREHYLGALPILQEIATTPELVRCLNGLGRVALDQGDLGGARVHLAQSLTISIATGSRTGAARGLAAFAALAVREGQPDRAVLLAAATTALRATAHLPGRPADRTRYLGAAAGLGETEAARLWTAGLRLTSSAAARVALEPPSGAGAGPHPPQL